MGINYEKLGNAITNKKLQCIPKKDKLLFNKYANAELRLINTKRDSMNITKRQAGFNLYSDIQDLEKILNEKEKLIKETKKKVKEVDEC